MKEINFEFDKKIPLEITTLEKSEDKSTYRLSIDFGKDVAPEPVVIKWTTPGNGAYHYWDPDSSHDKYVFMKWNAPEFLSRSASSMPIRCYTGNGDENRGAVYLLDSRTPISIKSGVDERTGEIEWTLTLFAEKTGMMSSYSTELVIDMRKISYMDVVAQASDLLRIKEGELNNYPADSYEPLYSTWYSYHQDVRDAALIEELRLASDMGMKVVIVDDGWQTDDNDGGYASCGDWHIAKTKIPDMKDFARRVHELGMKLMIWYSVPFVGKASQAVKLFEGKYLNDLKNGDLAYCLDPRYSDVREYLSGIYEKALKEWDLDGFKFDFIDSFKLTDVSSSGNPDMDTESLEDGICMLLEDIYNRLTAIKPDILIEFRQQYIGTIMQKYGNMLRVVDCPKDAVTNRIHSINLRMTSGKTAVHSDMIMWNYDDSPEVAAEQFTNIMFSVPQISMKLAELREDNREMLKFYLDLWKKNQQVLLFGKLVAYNVEANYSRVTSELDGEFVAALYAENFLGVDKDYSEVTIVNSSGADGMYISNEAAEYAYKVYSCTGKVLEEGIIEGSSMRKFDVPKSGVLVLEKR